MPGYAIIVSPGIRVGTFLRTLGAASEPALALRPVTRTVLCPCLVPLCSSAEGRAVALTRVAPPLSGKWILALIDHLVVSGSRVVCARGLPSATASARTGPVAVGDAIPPV
jgi:hypothetical protein